MNNIENNGGSGHEFDGGREGPGPDGPAPTAGPGSPSEDPNRASSITCPVGITGPSSWQLLLCGTDTLDLGFYVRWNQNWHRTVERFADLKLKAANTIGIELPSYLGDGLILPSGKPPAYSFHLILRGIQVWIARGQHATQSPNVYVSLPSVRLWHENIGPQVGELRRWIESHGGRVEKIIVSRWDIAADFLLPEGLTSDFLKTHLVSKALKRREDSKADRLETFYVGQGGGPIQLRIYDKAAEIKANRGEKNWFYHLWNVPTSSRVWRVEWQLRRLALKQFGVLHLDDLPEMAPLVWNSLTASSVSMRIPSDSNVSRRPVHPWWAAVQEVGEWLGSSVEAERNLKKSGTAPAEWYIAQAAGCLLGFAARQGHSEIAKAADAFLHEILAVWALRDFLSAYRVHRKRLNLDLCEDEEDTDVES